MSNEPIIGRDEPLEIEEVEAMLTDREIVGVNEGDPEFNVGKVLLFSMFVGEDAIELGSISGLGLDEVNEICKHLKDGGVFGAGIDHFADYMELENSEITLNCDIQCGLGRLKRGMKDGGTSYVMNDEGVAHVEQELLNMPKRVQ